MAGAIAAPLATAADASPCGGDQQVAWWNGPVQVCPLSSPLPPKGWVPVYSTPIAHAAGAPVPTPPGWLHGTAGQSFVCQAVFTSAEYYHPAGYRNRWWAYTKSDDATFGWVPEVFFTGGLDDEADAALRRCPASTTPQKPPPPGGTTVTPGDKDHDGRPDAQDACPNEDARPRDANGNGCLDYLRMRPEFKLTPDRFVRLVGGRYKPLGITVHRLTVTGLPRGATVKLTCSRSACKTQHATVTSHRQLEFKRMRGRRLRSGVRLTLRATMDGTVGAGAKYTVVPNDTHKRQFCILPGTTHKGTCSTLR